MEQCGVKPGGHRQPPHVRCFKVLGVGQTRAQDRVQAARPKQALMALSLAQRSETENKSAVAR